MHEYIEEMKTKSWQEKKEAKITLDTEKEGGTDWKFAIEREWDREVIW